MLKEVSTGVLCQGHGSKVKGELKKKFDLHRKCIGLHIKKIRVAFKVKECRPNLYVILLYDFSCVVNYESEC